MKKTAILFVILVMFLIFLGSSAFGYSDPDNDYDTLYLMIPEENGIRFIDYDTFSKLLNSEKNFVLVDVLLYETYIKGHIPGALSLPYNAINPDSARRILPEGSRLLIYCSGNTCHKAQRAARILLSLGYKVIIYKGGLGEWKRKGNPVEKQ